MTRKKMPSTVSFLKYLGLLSFVIGIVLTYISVTSNSLTVDYLQYFPSWFSWDLIPLIQEGSIFSAVFFAIAYLSSSLLYRFISVDSYNTSSNLMIKKITGESQEKYTEKNFSENDKKFAGLVREKIDSLSMEIDAARHDLFNLMLDINGVHSADDAQKSLDSLEKSIAIIKDLKKLKVDGE